MVTNNNASIHFHDSNHYHDRLGFGLPNNNNASIHYHDNSYHDYGYQQ